MGGVAIMILFVDSQTATSVWNPHNPMTHLRGATSSVDIWEY